MVSHGLLAMVWGAASPIRAVLFDREGGPCGVDSGFLVVYSDAPAPGDADVGADTTWICLHCLIDERPEVGAALDMARELGEVWLAEDGVWKPLDEIGDAELERLSRAAGG